MAKRFIETTIWTQNKWFRKLKIQFKILWFYLISSCDHVGVWEEDIELCSFIIGYEYSIDSLLKVYKNKIIKINDKKYWIVDFCNFQYGTLKEDNIKNKPHQSYISLLKKHNLWNEYLKTIDSLKDKDKEEDKVKEMDKEEDKEEDKETDKNEVEIWPTFEDFWNAYNKKIGSKSNVEKKFLKLNQDTKEIIMNYIFDYVKATPDKQYRANPETFLNQKRWENEIINQNGQGSKKGFTQRVGQYYQETDSNYKDL